MMTKAILTTCAMAALLAPAMGMEWTTDLDAAKQQAAAEGKQVLLHFTGSDWCGHCVRQHAAVFSKPEFEQYVQQKLVPVEVDLPNRKPMDAALRQKNEMLCEQFSITGFPTILVLTPEGMVVGGYSGNAGTPENAISMLDAAVANADKLKQAETLSGEQRLQKLAEVYGAIPRRLQNKARDLRRMITELDKDDRFGIQAEIRAEMQREEVQKALRTATPQQAVALIDSHLAKAEPANMRALKQMKLNALMMAAETEADVLHIADVAETMAQQYPRLLPMVQELRANPAAVLQQLKSMRQPRR